MSVVTAKIKTHERKTMYQDSDFEICPTCGGQVRFAPNLFGAMILWHKIPSPRLEGYFTFTSEHQNVGG
jgi:hypothetical protein